MAFSEYMNVNQLSVGFSVDQIFYAVFGISENTNTSVRQKGTRTNPGTHPTLETNKKTSYV